MADNGVDISGQTSKDLDALADHEFDYLIAPFERSQT
jgi:protein-tyrosine-phosphatase